jgi:hypothetical protein
MVRLPDGREMFVNCFAYSQAHILDYTKRLQARGPSLSSRWTAQAGGAVSASLPLRTRG